MGTLQRWMTPLSAWGHRSPHDRKKTRRDRRFRPTAGGLNWAGGEVLENRLVLSSSAQIHPAAQAHALAKAASGKNLKKAIPAGVIAAGQTQSFSSSVGKPSPNKFYQFSVGSKEVFRATLSGMQGDANLSVLDSSKHVIASSTNSGNANESVSVILGPGTYYLQVSRAGKAKTAFQLSVSAGTIGTSPGNGAGTTGNSGSTTSPGNNGSTTSPGNSGSTTSPGNSGSTTSPGNSGSTTGGFRSAIPSQGIYSITVSGRTYYGDTNFPASYTHYSPYANFSLGGVLVLTGTLDPYNASNNGLNPHDVIIHTGDAASIGLGGAGVMEYATNTGLHQLFGGNFSQGANVDVANVFEDAAAGTIVVRPDYNTALISQLNVMYVKGGLLAAPYNIVGGELDIQFSNRGTEVSGSITLIGQGFSGGSVAITATFHGFLQ